MNGYVMYDIARQQAAERQEAARAFREARSLRAAARGQRAKAKAEEAARPAIPDFAHEMFAEARDAVPASRK